MYWTNFFYWCFRWTFAVPVFLLLVATMFGYESFNRAFGVNHDRTSLKEMGGLMRSAFRICFIDHER